MGWNCAVRAVMAQGVEGRFDETGWFVVQLICGAGFLHFVKKRSATINQRSLCQIVAEKVTRKDNSFLAITIFSHSAPKFRTFLTYSHYAAGYLQSHLVNSIVSPYWHQHELLSQRVH